MPGDRHLEIRWRPVSARNQRRRVLASSLLLVMALLAFWGLLRACNRPQNNASADPTPMPLIDSGDAGKPAVFV